MDMMGKGMMGKGMGNGMMGKGKGKGGLSGWTRKLKIINQKLIIALNLLNN